MQSSRKLEGLNPGPRDFKTNSLSYAASQTQLRALRKNVPLAFWKQKELNKRNRSTKGTFLPEALHYVNFLSLFNASFFKNGNRSEWNTIIRGKKLYAKCFARNQLKNILQIRMLRKNHNCVLILYYNEHNYFCQYMSTISTRVQ